MKRLIELAPPYGWRVPKREAPHVLVGTTWRAGLLFNSTALWVGVHHSAQGKRTCINLVPCFTLWFTRPGGVLP